MGHPKGWSKKTHYMTLGGQCGQSCPCCRAEVAKHTGETLGTCPICLPVKKTDHCVVINN